MKQAVLTLLAVALFAGCATQRQVATMEGRGKREVYAASYDQVWRAAVDAAQVSDLQVAAADRSNGYIAAKRGIQPHTFGENVGIWVRPVSPTQTQVEVVSRQAGPPALWLSNWENKVLGAIRANLTREATGPILVEPAGAPRPLIREQAFPPVAPPRVDPAPRY